MILRAKSKVIELDATDDFSDLNPARRPYDNEPDNNRPRSPYEK